MASKTINAELFKQIFGLYATEIWAMPEPEFLEWLRREPKRGKWIYPSEIGGFGRCENCEALWAVSLIRNKFFKHCPRCGHPMEVCNERAD